MQWFVTAVSNRRTAEEDRLPVVDAPVWTAKGKPAIAGEKRRRTSKVATEVGDESN